MAKTYHKTGQTNIWPPTLIGFAREWPFNKQMITVGSWSITNMYHGVLCVLNQIGLISSPRASGNVTRCDICATHDCFQIKLCRPFVNAGQSKRSCWISIFDAMDKIVDARAIFNSYDLCLLEYQPGAPSTPHDFYV